MAYAIIGGLIVATGLTLLFLPALYVTWFRIKEPGREEDVESPKAHARSKSAARSGRAPSSGGLSPCGAWFRRPWWARSGTVAALRLPPC